MEDKNNDMKSVFYEVVETVNDNLNINCVKMISVYFNTQICREPMYRPLIRRKSLYVISNDNGVRIIQFSISKDHIVCNT